MNEKLFTNLGVKYVFLANEDNLDDSDCENKYSKNYYKWSTIMAKCWDTIDSETRAVVRIRHFLTCNDRAYIDPVSNALRFKVSRDEADSKNDYYCVAMGPGFARDAAELCKKKDDESADEYTKEENRWSYTFRVNFIDDNGLEFKMNVMMVEDKNMNDDHMNDPYNTHANAFLEFVTLNDYGFSGTPVGRSETLDLKSPNLDYDKLFGGTNVRVKSVYPYCDGWMIEKNRNSDNPEYVLNENRYGIPTVYMDMYEQGYIDGRNALVFIKQDINSNGKYKAKDEGADGFDEVTVNVTNPAIEAELRSRIVGKPFHENGTYYAAEFGAIGFDPVIIDVPTYKDQNRTLTEKIEEQENSIAELNEMVKSLREIITANGLDGDNSTAEAIQGVTFEAGGAAANYSWSWRGIINGVITREESMYNYGLYRVTLVLYRNGKEIDRWDTTIPPETKDNDRPGMDMGLGSCVRVSSDGIHLEYRYASYGSLVSYNTWRERSLL